MGVCNDCLVSVDGRQGQRACMTKVTGPHTVRRQGFPVRLPEQATGEAPILASDLAVRTPDLLVIGGGAGGLSAAAVAAEAGLSVVLIDERARPGGQFFKQPGEAHRFAATIAADRQVAEGRARIDRARRAGVEIVSGAEAWGAFAPHDDRRHDASAVAVVPATPADRRDGRLRARRAGPGMDAARRHDHGRGPDACSRPTACCPAVASWSAATARSTCRSRWSWRAPAPRSSRSRNWRSDLALPRPARCCA